jgi:hypothetical protein
MLKKILCLILAAMLINLTTVNFAYADSKAEKEAKFVEKVKTNIIKLGTGIDAKVRIKLKDGTKLRGFVSQINNNNFVVVDEKTGRATEVPYPNAKQVKGNNLSTGVTIAIGVAIFLVVVCLIGAYADD